MKSVTNNSYSHFLTSLALHLLMAALIVFGLKPQNIHLSDSTVDFILTPLQKTNTNIKSVSNPTRTSTTKKMDSGPDSVPSEPSAQAAESSNTQNTSTQTGTVATTTEQSYIAHVRWQLEKNKKFPILAKKQGHFGTVQIKFTVSPNGEIKNSEIAQSTDFDSLNQAALQILKSIKKFDPFPTEIKKSEWTFVLPIEYKLQ